MEKGLKVFVVVCAGISLLALVAGSTRLFGEETTPEELRARITVTKVVDGEYVFDISPPPWQKNSYAEQALHNYVEEWLAKNNREALSITHCMQGRRIIMVTRKT